MVVTEYGPQLPSCQENYVHNYVQVPTVWYDGKKEKGVCSQLKKEEFSTTRRYLGKTQSQMAQLLGVSLKAIQSFEQGWRKIPVHTERQLLFLRALKNASPKKGRLCWVVRKCPMEIRQNCPAWELQAGYLCWFINGTICQGQVQSSWRKKMEICRQCKVFRTMLPPLE